MSPGPVEPLPIEAPPIEPPPSRYRFEPPAGSDAEDLVAVGGDLEPGTILAAYRSGLFPMGVGRFGRSPIGWWSPNPRGVLLPGGLRVSRSLRAACRRFEVRVDTAFSAVVEGCADPSRPGRWITPRIAQAYQHLHELGWAHSVECWRDGRLAGGLYGLGIGGLFAGESMFHTQTDASKVALVALVDLLGDDGDAGWLLDVQWRTDHLAGLGVVAVPRDEYLDRLARSLATPTHPPPAALHPKVRR